MKNSNVYLHAGGSPVPTPSNTSANSFANNYYNASTSKASYDVNDFDSVSSYLSNIVDSNNALALQTAREQMGFQQAMNEQNNKFNQQEAEKNRLWQEMMSNTAHQREVQDLIKAGLNPVLSANLSGASFGSSSAASSSGLPQGAKAQLDSSLVTAIVNLMTASLNSSTQLKVSKNNNDTHFSTELMKSALSLLDFF